MADEIDIWRAASLLIKDAGDDAARIAADRANEMLTKGDKAKRNVWLGVLVAIVELTDTEGRGKSRH